MFTSLDFVIRLLNTVVVGMLVVLSDLMGFLASKWSDKKKILCVTATKFAQGTSENCDDASKRDHAITRSPLVTQDITIAHRAQAIVIMSSPGLKAQELHNSCDVAGLAAVLAPDCVFIFGEEGQEKMGKDEYMKMYKNLVAAFPDIHFAWSETNVLNDGTVTSKVVVTGTHTGGPFGFGPFPPIAGNGIKCQNDPENFEWIVEGDKVKTARVIPTKGSFKSGPPGFYLQIGGKME